MHRTRVMLAKLAESIGLVPMWLGWLAFAAGWTLARPFSKFAEAIRPTRSERLSVLLAKDRLSRWEREELDGLTSQDGGIVILGERD